MGSELEGTNPTEYRRYPDTFKIDFYVASTIERRVVENRAVYAASVGKAISAALFWTTVYWNRIGKTRHIECAAHNVCDIAQRIAIMRIGGTL